MAAPGLLARRRREVSWTPRRFAGLMIWLAADRTGSVGDGDPVTTWSDLSVQGNDATQATAAQKPVWKPGIVNGRPVIRFDGVDDNLDASSTTAFDFGTGDFTAFAVANVTADTKSKRILGQLGNASPFPGFSLYFNDSEQLSAQWRQDGVNETILADTVASGASFVIATMGRATGVMTLWKNGTQVSTATASRNVNGDALSIGAERTDNATETHTGDIAEVIIYNRALDTAQRARVERYLGAKYGLAVS